MPNLYFRFKQFTIHQDRCVMKVCTDSCILGAWTALHLGNVKNILDIGTGTGLLPLMLSQKTESPVDSIEWDPASVAQARENIQVSPWAETIRVLEGDARDFSFDSPYDFIITNPPFFASDLRSPQERKNKAKHDQSLTLDQLMVVINNNLNPNGNFSILLPYHRTSFFEELAKGFGFLLREKLVVRQTPSHPPFRSIGLFGFSGSREVSTTEMVIRDNNGKYTPAFTELMKDYY